MSESGESHAPVNAFSAYAWQHGALSDAFSAWTDDVSAGAPGTTHFGYVHDGAVRLESDGRAWTVHAGQYFCVPGRFALRARNSRGVLMEHAGWRGLFMIGGPVEQKGRLRYIDRCSDTTLIQPVRRGDPCLNLLYFPPGVVQTAHTHPSDRLGLVLSGHGTCIARNGDDDERIALEPGMIFCIHAEGRHYFSTDRGDELRVLAYHPDSDCGPTDDDHAMINRTIVDGVSARNLASIRTRDDATLESS
ncbi:quercetin dioxygenase-like cupin family protein [Paraburkholderia sp. JPY465]|uniref:cupin domain-containing protein n=1 Tax=Paraburkholderia sp. JPY465 TaxID=3042285 RepID=UPI003D1CCBAE